jgi:hypothetical protein
VGSEIMEIGHNFVSLFDKKISKSYQRKGLMKLGYVTEESEADKVI